MGLLAKAVLVSVIFLAVNPASHATHEASEPSDGTVRSFRPVNPHRPVPSIPFFNRDGERVSLENFRGKVVLINLWATWCPPCIRELPALDRLQAKFSTSDFEIVPIATDLEGLKVASPFYARLNIQNLGLYADPEHALGSFFPLDVFPANFIVNRQGELVSFLRSYVDWDAPEAEAMVEELIKQQ